MRSFEKGQLILLKMRQCPMNAMSYWLMGKFEDSDEGGISVSGVVHCYTLIGQTPKGMTLNENYITDRFTTEGTLYVPKDDVGPSRAIGTEENLIAIHEKQITIYRQARAGLLNTDDAPPPPDIRSAKNKNGKPIPRGAN